MFIAKYRNLRENMWCTHTFWIFNIYLQTRNNTILQSCVIKVSLRLIALSPVPEYFNYSLDLELSRMHLRNFPRIWPKEIAIWSFFENTFFILLHNMERGKARAWQNISGSGSQGLLPQKATSDKARTWAPNNRVKARTVYKPYTRRT